MDIDFYTNIMDIEVHIENVAEMIVISYLLYRFTKPFLNKRKYAAVAGITYLIVIIILYMSFDILHIEGPITDGISIAAAFTVMCFIDRRNIRQKVFLAFLTYLIIWIAGGIEGFIMSSLYNIVLPASFLGTSLILHIIWYFLILLMDIGLSIVVMAGLFHIVNKTYTYKKENMQSRELRLFLAPLLTVIVGNIILRLFSNAYLADTGQYIWYPHPEYLWIRFLYYLVSFAAIMAVMVVYQSIRDQHRQEKENVVLSEQVEQTKRNIKEIERLHKDVYRLRHDMGNHVAVLENLLLQHEPQETEKYLLRLKEQLQEITPGPKSGNPVTDIILTEKGKEAEERGADFRCDFHYPPGAKIDAFDVSVILNNALANAIEGAADCANPYVSISSYVDKRAYVINIKNNFNSKLEIDEETGLPESTKTDRENHGYGLTNIRKVAQKYLGDIAIEQDGQTFSLNVMLMLE